MSVLSTLAHDKNVILYRKELNKITGSVTATILLQQFIYWHSKSADGFYKFIEPCSHEKYREGDSWTEELGFSRKEFLTAYKKLEDSGLVCKKINSNRVTKYWLNVENITPLLSEIYGNSNPSGDLANAQKGFSYMPKGDLPLYTETTTENNTESANAPTQQAATTRTKKTTTKLEAKNDFEQELIDYRKSIKKPLVTQRGLTSLVNAIHSTAKAWSVHPDVVKNFMMDNEWQSVKPDYSNPFFNPKKQEASQPKPNVRYFDTQEEPKSEPQQDKQAIDKQIDELKDLFGEKI